jgi:adenine-specific DNA-methyltransferase
MANSKTRLELTWIGKENRPRLAPRVLLEGPAKGHPAPRVRVSPVGVPETNVLITNMRN